MKLTEQQKADLSLTMSMLFNCTPSSIDEGTIKSMFNAYIVGEGINNLIDVDDINFVDAWVSRCNYEGISATKAFHEFEKLESDLYLESLEVAHYVAKYGHE